VLSGLVDARSGCRISAVGQQCEFATKPVSCRSRQSLAFRRAAQRPRGTAAVGRSAKFPDRPLLQAAEFSEFVQLRKPEHLRTITRACHFRDARYGNTVRGAQLLICVRNRSRAFISPWPSQRAEIW